MEKKRPSRKEVAQKREVNWEAASKASGGALELRVQTLLQEHADLNTTDARVKTLAEIGWTPMKIGMTLLLEEKTIYNHESKIRGIAGVEQNVPFRTVFTNTPKNKVEKKRRIPGKKKDLDDAETGSGK